MAAFARWCYQHRIVVVAVWLVLLVALFGLDRTLGTAYSDQFSLPGTESTRALDLVSAALPAQAGDTDTIVWHVTSGSVNDPAVRSRIDQMLAKVSSAAFVGSVRSPYQPAGAAQISRDGRTAYAVVTFTKQSNELERRDIRRVIDLATAARTSSLEVELGGGAIQQATQAPPSSSTALGLATAAIIILIAFGSLLAMVLPLTTAVIALGCASFAVGLLTHVMSIPTVAPTLATLIGLGVGIDYALFIVTRHRGGLKAGLAPQEASTQALNTSGRAVLFAAGTVCIALMGLFVLRLSFLGGMAVAASLTVLFTVAAAVTLLPAMFGFLGTRVLSRRERRELASAEPTIRKNIGFWRRWAAFVSQHSAVLAVGAVLVMLVLAIPLVSLRLGSSDAGNDPSRSTTRKAYDLLAAAFGPGSNGPLLLVAETGSTADQAALQRLAQTLGSEPGVAAVVPTPTAPGAKLAIVQVIPTTAPQAAETSALINHLRNDVIPAAAQGTTLRVYVGGTTAIFDDFAAVIASKLPLFIAVIVGLGFVLLMVAFRSVLVPTTAAVMNLLAAAASFGVIVALFQWGWGSESLGLGKGGPVESFLPVIMLAILFGLSMDYQVFLVSRMHEEWVYCGDNERAVKVGQEVTGRVITAAAAIMICVFASFALLGQRIIAEFGIGLAVAVFLDAFILRTVLVPAVMHILGRNNWWLPGWLDRYMPQLSVEPSGGVGAGEPSSTQC